MLKDYVFSENLTLQKYAVLIIRKYISSSNQESSIALDNLGNNINEDFLSKLCSFLSNNNIDKCFEFEVCWILINIAFNNNGEEKIVHNEKNLKNILNFLVFVKNDKILLYHALWLIKNLTATFVFPKQFFIENSIFDIFEIIFDIYKFDEEIVEFLSACICNLCKYTSFPEYNEQYKKAIPIIGTVITITTKFYYFNIGLYVLFKFSLNEKLIDCLIANQIHTKIFDLYPKLDKFWSSPMEQEQLSLFCVKIIGNLLYGDYVQVQILINAGVVQFLNKLLEESNLKILKNTIWGICNIASGAFGQISFLFKEKTVFYVIQIGIDIYEMIVNRRYESEKDRLLLLDVFKEIIFMSSLTIFGTLFDMLLPFLNYKNCSVISFLCLGLELFSDNEQLILDSLKALHKVMAVEHASDLSMNDVSYINILINSNIKEKLEKLQLSPNEKIADKSSEFYDELFEEIEI